MKREEKASISIMKIICVSIILILISGISVMAVNTDLKDITIILQNGYEMTALTSRSKVSDILSENNIILNEDQKTIPDLDSEISSGDTIKITDKSYNEVQIAKISEEGIETSLNQLLENYAPITEKIVVEQVAIPYETITKNTTGTSTDTTNKVVQQGKDGIKEVTYKVKYQNGEEIEKTKMIQYVSEIGDGIFQNIETSLIMLKIISEITKEMGFEKAVIITKIYEVLRKSYELLTLDYLVDIDTNKALEELEKIEKNIDELINKSM